MRVVVVDKDDNFLRYKNGNDRNPEDIIRISGVWLINEIDEVLIAQRALDKVHDPGKWGPSAAGTVEEGENYKINAIKETEEELGFCINPKKLILGPKRFAHTSHKYFVQMYFYKTDTKEKDFKIQKDEVEQVKWIDLPTLHKWVEEKPNEFIASFRETLRDLETD
ncbi:NUDIX domain-containing protein [Candidatus Wolfebacteria bacterium]|nr:NUDIX domain-containing protein [Candidatus Wolfebacteria bacterium]